MAGVGAKTNVGKGKAAKPGPLVYLPPETSKPQHDENVPPGELLSAREAAIVEAVTSILSAEKVLPSRPAGKSAFRRQGRGVAAEPQPVVVEAAASAVECGSEAFFEGLTQAFRAGAGDAVAQLHGAGLAAYKIVDGRLVEVPPSLPTEKP